RTAEFGLDHVRGYADHGVRLAHAGIFAAQIKLLSQRILIPKVASRESLVDERNVWAAGGVIRSDRASANHGHSHYLCESGTDSAHEGMILCCLLFRPPNDVDGAIHVDALKWH